MNLNCSAKGCIVKSLILLTCMIFGSSCLAQSGPRNAPSDALSKILAEPAQVTGVPDKDGLQRALKELVQETEKLRGALAAPKAGSPNSEPAISSLPITRQANPKTSSIGDGNLATSSSETPDFTLSTGQALDTQDSVLHIQERIKLLKTIYQKKPPGTFSAGSEGQTAGPAVPEPPSRNRNPNAFPLPTNNRQMPPPPSHMIPNAGVMTTSSYRSPISKLELGGKKDVEVPPQPSLPEAERVLEDPVNALELGNSLFQTGNLGAALKAFNAVERDKLSMFDQLWLDYAIGCCHRRLGDQSKAEAVFRDLVNRHPQSLEPPVVQAKWWLNYLENKKAYLESTARLDQEIESLLQKANNSVDREPK